VSLGDDADHVLVKFWGAPFILTEAGKPIFKEPFAVRVRIPLLTDSKDASVITTQIVASTVGKGGEILLWA
jgi:hypothetical protein